MIKKLITFLMLIFCLASFPYVASKAQVLPQQIINDALMNRNSTMVPANAESIPTTPETSFGVKQHLSKTPGWLNAIDNFDPSAARTALTDTVFVGDVPNDTLVITGNYFNNGPILVFNDGVLIFENANATILGDLFVFQNGKMFADSSTLSFPQQYFYQRSWILANNGFAQVNNCTLDFTGLSHNLLVVQNAQIFMNTIQNLGFTTASAYGQATINIDSTNQAGEYILTDSASYTFNHAAIILLWHTVPDAAVFNMTFPSAGAVSNYTLNSSTSGVSGINYHVQVNNATDVMWALMPANGSSVTITGSTIRAIGLWFTNADTVSVSGLVNNSNYTSFTAPLNDRTLQLNNCSVQTWSLYVFDISSIDITGCIVGEVGNMGTSFITAHGVLCDGSGGYYWVTDTSFSIAVSSTVFTNVRSQGNAIFVFGYGSVNGGAAAIANSVMIVTQSSLPQDPIAYEHGIAWLVNINPLAVSYVNSLVNVNGSAWIDQGPLGSFMDFGSYDLWYSTSLNPNTWIPISTGNTGEVRNNLLAQWNTNGLTPGGYNLRLNTFNNLGDSIDAVKQVTLLPSVVGLVESNDENVSVVYPNPSNGKVEISFDNRMDGEVSLLLTDINGKILISQNQYFKGGMQSYKLDVSDFSEGIYFYTLKNNTSIQKGKIAVSK